MKRFATAVVAASLLACDGYDGESDVALETQEHTTLTPGKVAWVRMNGGAGVQRWEIVDSHPASNLTWVAGSNDRLIEVAAYDPYGTRVATASYGGGVVFDPGLRGFAVSHDDSHTMVRTGTPDGMGCPPPGAGYVTEIVHVELDGTCRWIHSFPVGVTAPRLIVDAGLGGSVVVAGTTFTELQLGSVTVGANVSPSEEPYTPAAFVVRLGPAGEVLWHRELGRADVADMVTDGLDGVNLVTSPSRAMPWRVVKLDASGELLWSRTLGTTSALVQRARLAGAPSGDLVVGGTYTAGWALDGTSFVDPGLHDDLFVLRLDGDSGAVRGARRLFGGALMELNGIAIDHHGNVAIAGWYRYGSFNLEPRRFVAELNPHGFVAMLSPDLATARWVSSYGSIYYPYPYVVFEDVAFTANSRVMVAGDFDGTADFGGHARTASAAAVLLRIYP